MQLVIRFLYHLQPQSKAQLLSSLFFKFILFFSLESPDIAPLVGESSRNVPLVKHSAQWRESHKNEIDDAIKSDTDWTFTTPYWGTAIKSNPSIFQEVMTKSSTHHSFPNDVFLPLSCGDNTDISLPMDLLTRRDPILFYTESDMLEDDLDDNGVMRCSAKLRIMESCWFLLIRQDIRVDGVLLRQIDSRICHIFGSDHIIREFSIKEASFEKLLKRGIDLTGAKLGLFVNDAEGRTGSEVLDANLDTIYEQKHKILLLSE